MIKHRTTQLGVAFLLAGTLTGCAGGMPFWSASRNNASDSQAARMAEAEKSIEAYKAQQQRSGTQPSYASKTEGGISGAYADAKQAVAKAFTPEPRVVQADKAPAEIGSDVFLTAGAYFEGQGDLNRAREQYLRVLSTEPENLKALISLARLSDRMGDAVEAEAFYQRAVVAHPQSGLGHNDLGLFFARQGQPQKAVVALEQAVTCDPRNLRYRNNFATLLVEVGQYDRALTELQRTSTPAEAHYNLGFLLHRNGQTDLARQHLHEAVRLNPHLQPAQELLAKLNAQQLHAAQPAAGGYAAPANEYQPFTASRPAVKQLPPVYSR